MQKKNSWTTKIQWKPVITNGQGTGKFVRYFNEVSLYRGPFFIYFTYCYRGKEKCSLYYELRYREVRYIVVPLYSSDATFANEALTHDVGTPGEIQQQKQDDYGQGGHQGVLWPRAVWKWILVPTFIPGFVHSRAIPPSNSRQAIHYALACLYFLNIQIWKPHLQLLLDKFSSLIGCGSLIAKKVNNSYIFIDNAILEKCLAT